MTLRGVSRPVAEPWARLVALPRASRSSVHQLPPNERRSGASVEQFAAPAGRSTASFAGPAPVAVREDVAPAWLHSDVVEAARGLTGPEPPAAAPAGPGTNGPATIGPATNGPATSGPATAVSPRRAPGQRRAPLPRYRLVRPQPPRVDPPSLDAQQRAVVAHRSGPLLVVGGPGTGKTTALVECVAARVAEGVDPANILV